MFRDFRDGGGLVADDLTRPLLCSAPATLRWISNPGEMSVMFCNRQFSVICGLLLGLVDFPLRPSPYLLLSYATCPSHITHCSTVECDLYFTFQINPQEIHVLSFSVSQLVVRAHMMHLFDCFLDCEASPSVLQQTFLGT